MKQFNDKVESPITQVLLTVQDVAKFLRVSPRTVWRFVHRGELPAPGVLMGRVVRWKPQQLAELGYTAQISEASEK